MERSHRRSLVPFASSLFPPAVPASGSASANLTISVPASPACVNGQIVTAKIRPLTGTGLGQCLCRETGRQMLRALPVLLTNFTVRQQNCKTTLSWQSLTEINFKKYAVQYSTDGLSAVGDMTDRDLIHGFPGIQTLPHFSAHRSVKLTHPIRSTGALQR